MDLSLEDAELIREAASYSDIPYGTNAGYQFSILKEYIEEFYNSLDDEHEVGIQLTSFNKDILLNVAYVGYEEPVLIIFKGLVNGKEATLIQHINQLSFLLVSIEKKLGKPKQKIGFAPTNFEEE